MSHLEIQREYAQIAPKLSAARDEIEVRLRHVLSDEKLKVYSIAARTKILESLKRKVSRPDRTYRQLTDITDIVGFRVITYFEDSIEEVGRLIEENFAVDFANSTNRLRSTDHERFGYRSLHYVCTHPSLFGLSFEIQIRTVLQHAWAEIEHDLGYKSIEGVPGIIRRRFSQIASILEIADREFVAIRKDVNTYEEGIRLSRIEGTDRIPLDLISLQAVLQHHAVVSADAEVAHQLKIPLSDSAFFPEYLLQALTAAHLATAQDVIEAVDRHQARLSGFIEPYFKFAAAAWSFEIASVDSVQSGYSLLFVAHLEMLARAPLVLDKVNEAARFYQKLDFPDSPAAATTAAHLLVDNLQSIGFFR